MCSMLFMVRAVSAVVRAGIVRFSSRRSGVLAWSGCRSRYLWL